MNMLASSYVFLWEGSLQTAATFQSASSRVCRKMWESSKYPGKCLEVILCFLNILVLTSSRYRQRSICKRDLADLISPPRSAAVEFLVTGRQLCTKLTSSQPTLLVSLFTSWQKGRKGLTRSTCPHTLQSLNLPDFRSRWRDSLAYHIFLLIPYFLIWSRCLNSILSLFGNLPKPISFFPGPLGNFFEELDSLPFPFPEKWPLWCSLETIAKIRRTMSNLDHLRSPPTHKAGNILWHCLPRRTSLRQT